MSPRNWKLRVEDMLTEINNCIEWTQSFDLENFNKDRMRVKPLKNELNKILKENP